MDLRELYDRVADLPQSERAHWLREHCPDEALRARVQRLLDASGADPLAVSPRERIAVLESTPAPATEVGGFRLIRPIGQGGMATVWLAERIGFEQRAAVKLLHRTLVSDFDRQLFERERRVLASLEHPNIARLIDGGIGANQQPWLAMEYVEGENLLEYARRRRLPPRARVALLLEVCEAVAAAHAQLVVHRDLKPGNVLVGADGRVKLLDFGIAKVLADEADLTAGGYAAFTPAYAAPEQVRGQVTSTATDVHALGVMAIELLLGLRPVDLHRLPPSQQALSSPEDQPTTRRELVRFLRGDLDNVLRKCIDEDPRRRYPGAQALADDLRRFLEDQPVTAHPPSRWYLVRKFARRHRGGVVVTAVLSLATLASLVLALWMGGQAREQARIAQAAAAKAQAESARAEAALKVSESTEGFLVEMFAAALPPPAGGPPPTASDLLLHAERNIEPRFAQAPEVAVRLYLQLAMIHRLLKADANARRLLGMARQLAQLRLPPDSEDWRSAVFLEAHGRAREGDAAALAEMRDVVANTPAEETSVKTLTRRRQLGAQLVASGKVDEGIAMQEATLLPLRTACERGEQGPCIVLQTALQSLSIQADSNGRASLAIDFARRALEETERQHGVRHYRTARALESLALLEARVGRTGQAMAHVQRALAIHAETGRAGEGRIPLAEWQRANLLWDSGRLLEAIETRERLIARQVATDPQDRWLPRERVTLARMLLQAGRHAQAAAVIDEASAGLEVEPERHGAALVLVSELRAQIAAELDGDAARALAEGERALALRRQDPDPEALVATLMVVQRAARTAGATAQADAWLAEARTLAKGIEPTAATRRRWLLTAARLALDTGDHVEAERHRQALLADLADESTHALRDAAQLLGLQIAAAQQRPAVADPAWLKDVEQRRGADSMLVRDAKGFGPR